MRHPRLPFGNIDPIVDRSVATLRDKISQAVAGDSVVDQLDKESEFLHAVNSATFGKLKIGAFAMTPVRIDRKSQTKPTLIIPFTGGISVTVDRKTYYGLARRTGFFCSGRPRNGTMGDQFSDLIVEIDVEYLLEVTKGMLGPQFTWRKDALRLDEDREIALNFNGISFDSLIRNHCRTLDDLWGKPEALALLGVDNAFYRGFAALLAPKLLFGHVAKGADLKFGDGDAIRLVCDYIQSRLDHPITLTALEQIGGISARRLQYGFLRKFGCPPMEWIRRERLIRAHALLLSPVDGVTVTGVAIATGFSHMGVFATRYRAKFGESPSVTLKRALAK
jgi:AraC-like DNA-binding protein